MSYSGSLGIIIVNSRQGAALPMSQGMQKRLALRGFGGLTCPPGFELDADGKCTATTATSCPPGFYQQDNFCSPSTPEACALLNAYYDPAKPDRCVKECPAGTIPDFRRVCDEPQEVPVIITGDKPAAEPAVIQIQQAKGPDITPWVIAAGAAITSVLIVGLFGKGKQKR